MSGQVVMCFIICFIEEARRERNTVEYYRNLVELEVRTCDSRCTEPSRAYFGTGLLPAIKSDLHPSNNLRLHAVLGIRRELSHSASCTLASLLIQYPVSFLGVVGRNTGPSVLLNINLELQWLRWESDRSRLLR